MKQSLYFIYLGFCIIELFLSFALNKSCNCVKNEISFGQYWDISIDLFHILKNNILLVLEQLHHQC